MIRRFSRRIDYWYDGQNQIVTDDLERIPGRRFDNGAPSGQYWDISADEIESHLEAIYKNYVESKPTSVLNWNEGLLRYQKGDIIGLVINPKLKRSVGNALAFRQLLGLDVGLYSYDPKRGAVLSD